MQQLHGKVIFQLIHYQPTIFPLIIYILPDKLIFDYLREGFFSVFYLLSNLRNVKQNYLCEIFFLNAFLNLISYLEKFD